MQVNTQNIQRPKLFSDFFNLEIDYKNDYLKYINTSNLNAVTSLLHIIKKPLKFVETPQSHNNALSLM